MAQTIQTVGIVGWGRMGAEIGRWLIERGWPVVATDVSAAVRERIADSGALPLDTVAEVGAQADLILVIVVDDRQVLDILTRTDGLLSTARPGTAIAVCASVKPQTCVDAAAAAQAVDVDVVDFALVGGERAAEQGSITLMCGGDAAVIYACLPALSAFAVNVCRVGDIGAGQVAKSANNILMWLNLRADVEVLRLARAYGVEPGKLRSILSIGTGGNRVLTDWGLHRMRWPHKDLEVALALAADAGVDVPLIQAVQPLLAELAPADLEALR